MIGIDLDGTILNYNHHTSQIRVNTAILDILRSIEPDDRQIAIITNQGGVAFHASNPARYPHPHCVGARLFHAVQFLRENGYQVTQIRVSAYHPKATPQKIASIARQLREYIGVALPEVRCVVHETARSRKPEPFMLKAAGISSYFGDSPEDMEAAKSAHVPGIQVTRYE